MRRIKLQMPPLDGRAQNRTQHVMDVIDRFRRVSRLDQMRHIRLDRWCRDVTDSQPTKSRNQMLLHDVPMVLLRRSLVFRRQYIPSPLPCEGPKRHPRSGRARAATGSDFPAEDLSRLTARNRAERLVTRSLSDGAVGSNLQLPPADRPPPSFFKQRTASI